MFKSRSKSGREIAAASVGSLAIALIVAIPPILQAASRSGDAVAVVFAPWTKHDDAIRHVLTADGILVRNGGMPWIIIARSDDPGFSRKLYETGAWLVGNALTDAGCAAVTTDPTT